MIKNSLKWEGSTSSPAPQRSCAADCWNQLYFGGWQLTALSFCLQAALGVSRATFCCRRVIPRGFLPAVAPGDRRGRNVGTSPWLVGCG